VRQIALNLLSNAVKYTHAGTVTFNVRKEYLPEDRINLIIEVADTGIGIKQEDLSKLFEEFTRLDTVKNRNTEGTGLGLVISRNLCRLMGGDITAESKYGEGSVFTAIISQTVTDASPFTINEQRLNEASFSFRFVTRDARILVVDDLPTNLTVARGLLAPYQMEIDTALSGEDAVNLVKKQHYDLVLMDHMMPGMDGVEAVELIRRWEKEQGEASGRIPVSIVALTANAVSGMREMFLTKGFDDFLSKPIDVFKLDGIIAEWIPKEKQVKAGETQGAEKEPAQESLRQGLVIPGVDTGRGIIMCGGTIESYKQVLSTFRKDAEKRIDILRKVPDGSELASFVTQVHALKSASASIGADEISRMAAELEEAGKNGDTDFIGENLAAFRENLSGLVDLIKPALAEYAHNAQNWVKTGEPCPAGRETLSKLKAALEAEDIGEADALLDELEAMPIGSKTKETLSAVAGLALISEFEDAPAW
jgi:CheY-like chemotaxis protein